MAVNDPDLGSFANGKGKESLDRSFERAGTPMYLGEQSSPLDRGKQSHGEVVRVDTRWKFPFSMK